MNGPKPPPPPADTDAKPKAAVSAKPVVPPPSADPPRASRPVPQRPYRRALGAAVSSALVAALLVGAGDALLTLGDAQGVVGNDAITFIGITIGLYLAMGLVVGLLEGIVVGAFWATHPRGGVRPLWNRLADDRALDRAVAGWIVAGAIAAGLYAIFVAVLIGRFVIPVEKKDIGALLVGGAAAVALPLFAFLAYPFYRVTRVITRAFPRLGPVPGTVVLLLLAGGFGLTVLLLFVTTRLDWRALPLGTPLAFGAFFLIQLLWLGVARPPLTRKVAPGKRRVALGLLVALAIALPLLTLSGKDPSERVVSLVTTESKGGKALAAVARRGFDRDGDGFSTLLGGGDCDDARAKVYPGAEEIEGNGLDDNCVGGDKVAAATPPPDVVKPVTDPTTAPKAAAFKFDGNILFIAIDTVRADRLGAGGYRRDGRSLTPNIDKLIERGVWFTRAYAQAPNTPRSFPSMFTSRYPSQVKFEDPNRNYPKLVPDNLTLFEILKDKGWKTHGQASHFYFSDDPDYQTYIIQGFDEFDNTGWVRIKESNHDIAAPRIVPRATAKLAELAKSKERFILFTHLFEPHSTYMVHKDKGWPAPPSGEAGLMHKYDYEILYVDEYVGQLVEALAANGLDKNTMVVLVSDHGEAFGTHRAYGERMFFHGQTLYDELLRVPLLFVIPGMEARKIDQPVMLIDVVPTLLTLTGIPVPALMQGRSLVPAMTGEPLDPAPVHAELMPAPSWKHSAKMRIAADGKTKVIYKISDNLFELYDLAADPDEKKDLVNQDKEVASKMKQEIATWMDGL